MLMSKMVEAEAAESRSWRAVNGEFGPCEAMMDFEPGNMEEWLKGMHVVEVQIGRPLVCIACEGVALAGCADGKGLSRPGRNVVQARRHILGEGPVLRCTRSLDRNCNSDPDYLGMFSHFDGLPRLMGIFEVSGVSLCVHCCCMYGSESKC